jgi:hypothetical protein
MRKLSVLLAGLLSAGLAHAGLVTYEFTASFASLKQYHPAEGYSDVNSSIITGFPITVGDTLHGSFTWDTSTPVLYTDSSGTFNTYDTAAGQNAFTVIFNSNSYTVSSANNGSSFLGTQDKLPGQGQDSLHIGTGRDTNSGGYESFGLVFSDPSATALTYNHIPSSLTAFPLGTFGYSYTTGQAPHALGLTGTGTITSLTLVSAVPEPATYMLMVSGLGLLAWRRQRNGKSAR